MWKVDQKNYTQSGTYEADFVSKDGCDSIHLLRLSINKEIEVYAPNVIHPGGINQWFSIFVYAGAAQIKRTQHLRPLGIPGMAKQSFPPNELQQGWNGMFKGQKALPGYMSGARWLNFRMEVSLEKEMWMWSDSRMSQIRNILNLIDDYWPVTIAIVVSRESRFLSSICFKNRISWTETCWSRTYSRDNTKQ